ncbi:MAG: MBL fold metallo-hydrolase [Bacteroidales bacterium]|jgi:phosphoribosyl 1,2-cyclic phosphodiesterase|nr:MBL fold metallo-hydrolase [Bacteroidales bacterium]
MDNMICVGSGSAGNAYILRTTAGTLLIEAGLPVATIKRSLNYKISDIAGCLISHSHGDHAKHAGSVAQLGIPVYVGSTHTANEIGISCICLPHDTASDIGEFKVLPFFVRHDVTCCGYLIYHADFRTLFFATDLGGLRDRDMMFYGVNHVLIECNYQDGFLAANNAYPAAIKQRVRQYHLSLDGCVSILRNNISLKDVKTIGLIHLSRENTDKQDCLSRLIDAVPRTIKCDTY